MKTAEFCRAIFCFGNALMSAFLLVFAVAGLQWWRERGNSKAAVDALNILLWQLRDAENLDMARGIGGEAAARYFGWVGRLV